MILRVLSIEKYFKKYLFVLLLTLIALLSVKAQNPIDSLAYFGQIDDGGAKANPVISEVYADEITATSATLHATVYGNGVKTYVSFAYGTTTSYGELTDLITVNAYVTKSISVEIEDLSPNTTYHFRVKATQINGNYSQSDDYQFYTSASNNHSPVEPYNPSPSNGATNIPTSLTLSWNTYDPDGGSVGYALYFGTSSSNLSYQFEGSGTTASLSGLSQGQTYYWKIMAYDEDDNVTHGPVWHFTTENNNQPPVEPYNPNPSNGATNVSMSPTLSWNTYDPDGGSVGYALYFGTSSSNLSYQFEGSGTTASLSGLSQGQTYYWKIMAYDEDDNVTHGPVWHFTTENNNQPPVEPYNPNPSNGATNVSMSPTLSWNTYDPDGGSVGYALYFGTSSSNLSYQFEGSGTTASLSGLSQGQTYYWKIMAYDEDDNVTHGPVWHFTTENNNQPPVEPYNPNPSNGATNVSMSPTLSWNTYDPDGGSVGYALYLGTSSSNLSYQFEGSGTTASLSGLSQGQTYYWKIMAYDEDDNVTHGPVWHFTTESGSCFNDCTSGDCGVLGYQEYEAANYLCQLGIVEGVNGNLNPDVSITRAQLAKTALYGLFKYNGSSIPNPLVSDYFPCIYSDLQENSYYYQSAKALLYLDYGDGRTPFDRDRTVFNPTGTISRCLVLKVLLETFNIAPATSGSNPFNDYDSSQQFWGYAKKAYNLNIVQANNFRPYDDCTRGEAFLYLYRILMGIANNTIPAPNPVNSEIPASSSFFIPANLSPAVVNAMRGVEYGNFNYYEKDFFEIPGYLDLAFGISYNSYLTEMPDDLYPVKPLGKAWTHNYDMYMNVVADGYNNTSKLVFHMQNGSLLIYNQDLSKVSQGDYSTLTTSGSNKYILTSPDQTAFTFQRYSTDDNIYYLTKINDRNNNTINIDYESGVDHYRISSVTAFDRTLTFYYTSGTDLLRYVKDPISRKVWFYYTDGELTSLKDAKDQTTYFTYGTMDFEKGLLKNITLPEGDTVYNQYEQRKLTSTKLNNDTPTTVEITPSYRFGNISSIVTQPIGNGQTASATYTINGANRITKIQDSQYTNVTYTYGDSNHPALVTSMKDNKTNVQTDYTYNSNGMLTQKIVSSGGQTITTKWEYNSLNDVTKYTDGNGHETNFYYDGNGNLESVTDAMGHTTSMSNNSHGVPTQITDVNGKKVNIQYNSYGNISQVSIPSINISSSLSYDNVSRTVSVTDFGGRQMSYAYDNNDNIVSVTDAIGKTTTYSFDANDNLTQITNALGKSTNLTYDDNDFLSSVSFQGFTKSYTYNSNGTVKSYTTPNGHTFNYTYNDAGDLTNDGYATYSYNDKGQLVSVTKDGKAVTYAYDGFSRPVSVTYDGKTIGYTYDNNNNVTSVVYPGNKTVTYTYDALNRITSVKDWNNATTSYSYRNDGLIDYYQYPNNVRTTFSYDASARCIAMVTKRNAGNGSVIAQYVFGLDANGNHTSESVTEPFAEYPDFISNDITYNYNNANRLTSAGDLTFGYDNNGNNTSRSGRSYGYDVKNNLTSVSGDITATYTYDGFGNRRSATRNGVTKKYVIDPLGNNSVLIETDGSGNVQYYYVYGPSGLISRISASNETRYYVYDYRGSTVAMTDASTSATVTHKYQYDDFGKLLQSEEADENLFRFVGSHGVTYENEALAFMRARYYDPEIGRFLSEDPVWSPYLYPYADNNPITGIDPEGTYTKEVVDYVLKNSIFAFMQNDNRRYKLTVLDYAVHGTSVNQVAADVVWEGAGKLAGGTSYLLAPIKCEIELFGEYADARSMELDAINKQMVTESNHEMWARYNAEQRRKAERAKLLGMLNNEFAGSDLTKQRWVVTYKAAQTMPEAQREKCLDDIYHEMKRNGY